MRSWPATIVRFARAASRSGLSGGLLTARHGAHRGLSPDQLATYDPIATDASATLVKPNEDHWLGTDHLGRDMYSRLVHGPPALSLIVGIGSTLLGSVLGGIIGLLSGYAGGKTDLIAQRPARHSPGAAAAGARPS